MNTLILEHQHESWSFSALDLHYNFIVLEEFYQGKMGKLGKKLGKKFEEVKLLYKIISYCSAVNLISLNINDYLRKKKKSIFMSICIWALHYQIILMQSPLKCKQLEQRLIASMPMWMK